MQHKIPTLKTNAVIFSLILAVYFFLFLNLPLLARLHGLMQEGSMSTGFSLTIPLFFIAAFNLIFIPFTNNRFRKPIFITLLVLSAGISYATFNYGIVFSQEMIGNFAETNSAEAYSYLNGAMLLWVIGLGVIPAVLVWKTEVTALPRKKIFLSQLYSFMTSLLVISLIAAVYYQDYAVTWRNNRDIRNVIVPTYAISSGVKYIKHRYFDTPLPYTPIGLDAQIARENTGKKRLTVIVIGETARAHNYSLNGYAKDTNRFTRPHDVNFYKNVSSCGTETSVSVPCMFSNLTRGGYSHKVAQAQDNLIDILDHAGVETLWIENNGGCKDVCKNTRTIDIRQAYAKDKRYCGTEGCYDGAIVEELSKQMNSLTDSDTVVFLHLMGSHGPSYYKRYPEDMAAFMPDCRRSDIQNCTADELENAYDNTILYTDKILADIIDMLKVKDDTWETSLLYLSDHGESLGESGVYLHGLPYSIAPDEQKKIPLITWLSPAAVKAQSIGKTCLSDIGIRGGYSQDNFFHTVLGMAGVSTQAYKHEMDILDICRKNTAAHKQPR